MKQYLPFLQWIKRYTITKFWGDLPAGITVGVLLIPQGMAYAMIAGLPPVFGLYAAIVPSVIYSLLGTSRQLSVGPVAMDSIMVAAGLATMSVLGSEHYILLSITLAFIIGCIQIVMGMLKLGFLVNFLSKPVISGFTTAVALVIIVSQLPHLLGIHLEAGRDIQQQLFALVLKFDQVHILSLSIGALGIILLFILRKLVPKLPSAIVLVVIGIIAAKVFKFSTHGVGVVGEIPSGLPVFKLPVINLPIIKDLLVLSFTLAMVGFMEAISVGKAMEQKQEKNTVKPNQELLALGAANLVGSFFQSYPTTGGFSRTAVNAQSGAKTGIAGVISAVVVAVTLLFLTPLFQDLPNVILAAIIIVAAIGLVDVNYPKRLWTNRREEFFLLIFTFLITLFVGIKEGILLGIGLALLLLIYRTTQPHIAVLGKIKGKNVYKNVSRFSNHEQDKEILILRFDSQLYFANANFFKENLHRLIKEKENQLQLIILSAEGINYIDSSAAHMLSQVFKELKQKGYKIKITNAIGPVRDIFKKSDIRTVVGTSNFHLTIADAIASFQGQVIEDHSEITLQTNT